MSVVNHFVLGGIADDIGPLRTSFPDDHRLAGVYVKLEQARKHLKVLNSEMSEYLGREPYSFELEKGRRRTEYVLKAYTREPPPLAWSASIGDFLQNLRTALEYLVWELARANVGREPRRRTSFPVYVSERRFLSDGRGKIQDLAPEPRAVIERMQPYNSPTVSSSGVVNMHAIKDLDKYYRSHLLWRLNELARRDRHQALRVVSAATWGAGGTSASELPGIVDSGLEFGPFQAGSVIARWVLSEEATASVRLEERAAPLTPTVSLALDEEEAIGGYSAIMMLVRLLNYVDGEVIPELEHFA